MALDTHPSKPNNRPDLLVLWGGILFSLAFTGLIWWAGARLDAVELLPDQGVACITGSYPTRLLDTSHCLALLPGAPGGHMGADLHCPERQAKVHHQSTQSESLRIGCQCDLHHLAFLADAPLVRWLAQDVSIFSSQGSVIVLLYGSC